MSRVFRRGFSASVAGRNWRLSARRNFSQTIDVVNGPLCVVRARARARARHRYFSAVPARALSRALSRESARPLSIGSGTNKLTWQLNVSRRRARIIARVSQRAHCAWRKNRLRARPPAGSRARALARAPRRRKSRLVSLHPRKGGKSVTFACKRIGRACRSASEAKRACKRYAQGERRADTPADLMKSWVLHRKVDVAWTQRAGKWSPRFEAEAGP